jgi:hypothetical protein
LPAFSMAWYVASAPWYVYNSWIACQTTLKPGSLHTLFVSDNPTTVTRVCSPNVLYRCYETLSLRYPSTQRRDLRIQHHECPFLVKVSLKSAGQMLICIGILIQTHTTHLRYLINVRSCNYCRNSLFEHAFETFHPV